MALVALSVLAGCDEDVEEAAAPPEMPAFGAVLLAPAPGDVPGMTCVDVGRDHRACFRGDDRRLVERPSPAVGLPADGQLRCWGQGEERRCEVAKRQPFECDGEGECVQAFPRLPSDGPTECADVDGVVICRTRSEAAGVVEGPDAHGWLCGDGRPRICVDLAPDRQGAAADCHFEHQPTISRVCREGRSRGRLEEEGPCQPGLSPAADGSCVPTRLPDADCWTTADCADGESCVLSSCAVDP